MNTDFLRPKIYTFIDYESKQAPVVAVGRDELIVGWVDSKTSKIFFDTTEDGRSFKGNLTILNENTSNGITYVKLLSTNMVAFLEKETNAINIVQSKDSENWRSRIKVTTEHITENRPSLANGNTGRYYLAWKKANNKIAFMRSNDGINWDELKETEVTSIKKGPSIQVHNGKVIFAYTDINDRIKIKIWDEEEESFRDGENDLNQWTKFDPGIIRYKNKIYLTWRGAENDWVYSAVSTDGINYLLIKEYREIIKNEGPIGFNYLNNFITFCSGGIRKGNAEVPDLPYDNLKAINQPYQLIHTL